MCLQVFGIDFDLSLVLKIGIKNIFYKVACLLHIGFYLKGVIIRKNIICTRDPTHIIIV